MAASAIVRTALEHYGRLDILIHNAGNVRRGSLKEMSYEDFDAVLDVHLRGAFNVVRQAFPVMCAAGYGRIVLTSSIGGLYGNHDVANYAAAKAGVIGLSNVAALEGAADGVTMQRDRAGRGDENGRRHRHLGLPADGPGARCARGGLARTRILFGDRGGVHRAGGSGGAGGHRRKPRRVSAVVDGRGRRRASRRDSKQSRHRWFFRSCLTVMTSTSATASDWRTVPAIEAHSMATDEHGTAGRGAGNRPHRNGDGTVLHADHGRHGR